MPGNLPRTASELMGGGSSDYGDSGITRPADIYWTREEGRAAVVATATAEISATILVRWPYDETTHTP